MIGALIQIVFGWLLVEKVPRWIKLPKVLQVVMKIIGRLIIVRAGVYFVKSLLGL